MTPTLKEILTGPGEVWLDAAESTDIPGVTALGTSLLEEPDADAAKHRPQRAQRTQAKAVRRRAL